MRVFVTGATGFIGSAIVQELIGAGHQVLGLARSDAGGRSLAAAGAKAHWGTLDDLESLKRGTAESEGVIHTAFNHDFVNVSRELAAKADLLAIEAIGAALAGSGRPFLISSGMAGRTEEDEGDGSFPRLPSERVTLALATKGVRTSVVRLPPSVHGEGDHGLVPALIGIARAKGASAYIGEGQNRWPAVHRLDAARLYRLALEKAPLEKAPAGSRFHAVAEEGVPTREIAEVIGRRLNLPVVSKSPEQAADHFGWLGHFFAMDRVASSARTREWLGWRPTQAGLISDLDHPRYFGT
jgi:nucleoside-diphosphate-sugar epimerase